MAINVVSHELALPSPRTIIERARKVVLGGSKTNYFDSALCETDRGEQWIGRELELLQRYGARIRLSFVSFGGDGYEWGVSEALRWQQENGGDGNAAGLLIGLVDEGIRFEGACLTIPNDPDRRFADSYRRLACLEYAANHMGNWLGLCPVVYDPAAEEAEPTPKRGRLATFLPA